ncbi:hypothetical protein IKG20_01830, partial [Candidatus Saccharibacteria bacterium]|nr:hypothetical protein [Candidatus Saccharibacteria bacterium]
MRRLIRNRLLLIAFFSILIIPFIPTQSSAITGDYGGQDSGGPGGSGTGDDKGRRTWVYYAFDYDTDGNVINPYPTVAGQNIWSSSGTGCAAAGGFFFAHASRADGVTGAVSGTIFDESYSTLKWAEAGYKNTYPNNCNGNTRTNDTYDAPSVPFCLQGLEPTVKVEGLTAYSIPSYEYLEILNKGDYTDAERAKLKEAFGFDDTWLNTLSGMSFYSIVRPDAALRRGLNFSAWRASEETIHKAIVKITGAIEQKLYNEFSKISGGQSLDNVNVAWFCSAAESTFTGSSSAPDDYTSSSEKTYPEFTHTITRNGGDDTPTWLKNEASINTTCYPSSACASTGSSAWSTSGIELWGSATTNAKVEVTLKPGDSVKVCQEINYESKKTSGFSVEITGRSIGVERATGNAACVTITRPVEATAHATATVKDGVSGSTKKSSTSNSKDCTITAAGSSYNASCNTLDITLHSFTPNYSVSFNHSIQTSGYGGITASPGVKIYHSESKGQYSSNDNVLNGTSNIIVPNTAIVRPATSATYSGSIGEGSGKTLCEVVMLTKNHQTFANATSTSPKTTESVGVAAEVCAKITRLKAKIESISARGAVFDDISGKDRTGDTTPVLSKLSWNNRYAVFRFSFDNSSSTKTPGGVYYEIDYSIDGVEKKNVSNGRTTVSTGNEAGKVIYKLALSGNLSGTKHTICARIRFNPSSYRVESNGSVNSLDSEALNSNGNSGTHYICVTYTRPEKKVFPTKIIVTGKTEANIDSNTVGPAEKIPGTSSTAYPIKKSSARAVFKHTLSRGVEYHDPNGTNSTNDSLRVLAISPDDDVKDLRYIFDDPGKKYSPSSFNNRSNNRLSTNSSSSYSEIISGLGASASVGQIETKCRKIYFNSEIYQLQGEYYVVDGKIWTGDHGEESIQGRKTPIRLPAEGTVGSSTEDCVSVIRPYNFDVTSITTTGSTTPATPTIPINATFTINVERNTKDFLLTDLPKSPESQVELISFVVSGKPGDGDLAG